MTINFPFLYYPSAGIQMYQSREQLIDDLVKGNAWLREYIELDPTWFIRVSNSTTMSRADLVEVIRRLPDSQKPHLPEGHIWFETKAGLTIRKHIDAPLGLCLIHTYGPDSKGRFQFLVSQGNVPTQGFAMTIQEGFSRIYRNKYPSKIRRAEFKVGSQVFWKGHIIDYQDTMGTVHEDDDWRLSTLFYLNYKPEPNGAWARNLRELIVRHLRAVEGAYKEIILYAFAPERLNGGLPIPEAVVMETYNYKRERSAGYYVPRRHSCHDWKADNHKSNFCRKSLKKLTTPKDFPALVCRGNPNFVFQRFADSEMPGNGDVHGGYQLMRAAEMECNSATLKLKYAIYGAINNASSTTVEFWLRRSVRIARIIDGAFESKMPGFPLSLLNQVSGIFKGAYGDKNPTLRIHVEQLELIAHKVSDTSLRLGWLKSLPVEKSE